MQTPGLGIEHTQGPGLIPAPQKIFLIKKKHHQILWHWPAEPSTLVIVPVVFTHTHLNLRPTGLEETGYL
jgi:hypothetical protein